MKKLTLNIFADKLSNELSFCVFRNHRYPLDKDGKPI
jgi:hypothetical protein